MKKILNKHYPVIIYLIIFTVIFSLKIINNPLPFFDWDESIYAEVGKEMVTNKSYFVPLWQNQNWLDKPPLVPLFYGVVAQLTSSFLAPEVSTRLATLYLSVFALILIYKLYYKIIKETWLTTLIVITTSLTSIFLQRAQVLNVDIFLLIGWLGYLLYYKRFWISLIFLSFAVYSKSMIGFYPIGVFFIYFLYEAITHKITWKDFINQSLRMMCQALILMIWHLAMFLKFGNQFLYEHFYESHIKRVTASIESHFGQRTFYITLLLEQYGKYVFMSIVGVAIILYQWFAKKISDKNLFKSFFFIPWFVFLNLTKTKIFWYGHPYLAQFAFLIFYPIKLLRKYGLFYYPIIIFIMIAIFNKSFIKDNVLDDFYSSNDAHHAITKEANNKCTKLNILVGKDSREASQTLEEMDLLITTSKWWGNHPSMVYYFDNKDLNFIYTTDSFSDEIKSEEKNECFVIEEEDENIFKELNKKTQIDKENNLLLFETIR